MKRLLFCLSLAICVALVYPALLITAFEVTQAGQTRIVLDQHLALFFLRGIGIGFVACYAVKRLAPRRKRKLIGNKRTLSVADGF